MGHCSGPPWASLMTPWTSGQLRKSHGHTEIKLGIFLQGQRGPRHRHILELSPEGSSQRSQPVSLEHS